MNTWTDSGLSEAGLIGAKLAIGVEARLPDGPARAGRGGSHRGGRRRAPELSVPAADYADSYADSYADAGPASPGAHRAPEDVRGAGEGGTSAHGGVTGGVGSTGGFGVTSRVAEESGSHHAVSRTGGRHRTLRAVSH